MADEFKTRKDIEILYDLIYNRTSDSPVAQKSEFDTFKDTVINEYAKSSDIGIVQRRIDELSNDVWTTLYDGTDIQIYTKNRNVKVVLDYQSSVSLTDTTITLLDLDGLVDSKYYPPFESLFSYVFTITYEVHPDGFIYAHSDGTGSVEPHLTIEYTI